MSGTQPLAHTLVTKATGIVYAGTASNLLTEGLLVS